MQLWRVGETRGTVVWTRLQRVLFVVGQAVLIHLSICSVSTKASWGISSRCCCSWLSAVLSNLSDSRQYLYGTTDLKVTQATSQKQVGVGARWWPWLCNWWDYNSRTHGCQPASPCFAASGRLKGVFGFYVTGERCFGDATHALHVERSRFSHWHTQLKGSQKEDGIKS